MSEKCLYFSLTFDVKILLLLCHFDSTAFIPGIHFRLFIVGKESFFSSLCWVLSRFFFLLLSDIFLYHFSDHFLSYFFLEFLLVTYQNSYIDSPFFFNFDSVPLSISSSFILTFWEISSTLFQKTIAFFSDFTYSFNFQEHFLFFKSLYIVLWYFLISV